MKAEISFSNLYWNDSLRGFFFRTQAENTFNEITQMFVNGPDDEDMMNEFFEHQFSDVDEMEEYFYSEPDSIIIANMKDFGLSCSDDDDEED